MIEFTEIDKTKIDSKLEDMRKKICSLSEKLNKYVQLNGCSPELKEHAQKVLGEQSKKKDQ